MWVWSDLYQYETLHMGDLSERGKLVCKYNTTPSEEPYASQVLDFFSKGACFIDFGSFKVILVHFIGSLNVHIQLLSSGVIAIFGDIMVRPCN